MAVREFLFTSESVTEGHPDKVADQISDTVLDAVLTDDPGGRVACETLITTGLVVVAGDAGADAAPDHARPQDLQAARGGTQGRRAALPATRRQGAGDGPVRGRRRGAPDACRDRAHPRFDAARSRLRRRDADQARPD